MAAKVLIPSYTILADGITEVIAVITGVDRVVNCSSCSMEAVSSLSLVAISIVGLTASSILVSCCGHPLKNESRIRSKSEISDEVGISGPFFPRVSWVDSSAVFSVSLFSSIIEMTLVNRRCLESERPVFGFRKQYRWAADLFKAAPGAGLFWEALAVLEP